MNLSSLTLKSKLLILVFVSIVTTVLIGGTAIYEISLNVTGAGQDNSALEIIIFVMVIGIALQIVLSWILIKFVTENLDGVVAILNQMAKGNLTIELFKNDDKDEIVHLYNTLHDLQDKLTEVIGGIRMGSGEVEMVADQVSQGNANLSQRTQEQASTLEEVASSMEQMTSTVDQNAENAGVANQLALAARKEAEKGEQVVGDAVNAMNEISEASKKIADIIGVIDEIAFQTNLLALNAAVEAARAGEQGRGFAVVAAEVRNLAGRSATAAKEINTLIQNSVSKVEQGTVLVNDSGKMLSEIVDSVKKVADVVAEISAASREQSSGIGQVNTAVLQMDEMTQQNASLVEQAAAAAESMGAQAQELNGLVTYFKLANEDKLLQKHKVIKQSSSYQEYQQVPHQKANDYQTLPSSKNVERQEKLLGSQQDDEEWEEF